MLYVCGTPIGNLQDITLRVIETLKLVDIVACEDTRHTLKLLNHFDIKAKLTSYHKHNKHEKAMYLINEMKDGKSIALVTDAGMPCISDPGEDLVRLCYENNIAVTSCPGATAVITALVLSGFCTRRYVFEGFLPKNKKERKNILEQLKSEVRTIVLYESPHNLLQTLSQLSGIFQDRQVAVIREITKKYEQVIRGDFTKVQSELVDVRGEFVIVIDEKSKESIKEESIKQWSDMSIEQHLDLYSHLPKKDAMKAVAKDRGISKRDVYTETIVKD